MPQWTLTCSVFENNMAFTGNRTWDNCCTLCSCSEKGFGSMVLNSRYPAAVGVYEHATCILIIFYFFIFLNSLWAGLCMLWLKTDPEFNSKWNGGFLFLAFCGWSYLVVPLHAPQKCKKTFFVSLADNFCFLDSAALKMVFCIPHAFLSLQKENVAMPSFCFFCWRGGWKDRPTRQEIVRKGWELRDT